MLSVSKASGRPLPKFTDDEVLDFQITEAVVMAYAEAQKKAQEAQATEAEMKSPEGLHGHRNDDFLSKARSQDG